MNVAARLENSCEPGGILISHSTWALVKDGIRCGRREEKLSVKGLHRKLTVYDVVRGAFSWMIIYESLFSVITQ